MRRVAIIVGVCLGTFLVLAGAVLGATAFRYKDSFYPGVKVAGITLANQSQAAGTEQVQAKMNEYVARQVVVTIPDQEISTTAGELGLSVSGEAALNDAWGIGHSRNLWTWFTTAMGTIFNGKSYSAVYEIDQNKVTEFVNAQVATKLPGPVSAQVSVSGASVAVSDSQIGQSVDVDELTKKLSAILPQALEDEVLYVKAPVSEVDASVTKADVQPFATQLDNLGNMSLTLTGAINPIKPTRTDMLQWFSVVQDDSQAISLSLNSIAISKYLTTKVGKQIDSAKSLAAVTKELQAALDGADKTTAKKPSARTAEIVLKPTEAVQAGSYTLGLYEGKYIQVNLKEQKLYRINGNTLEKVYIVSTGKWSTPTPVGTFNVSKKIARAWSATFKLYMPYFVNFTGVGSQGVVAHDGEFGFHELPEWPSGYKEGQNHLGTAVSHGCVRLGIGDAKEVYDWADTGIPVVIN